MARNSQFLYAEALASLLPTANDWLDLGCGHQFVPGWVPSATIAAQARTRLVAGVDADLDALRRHPPASTGGGST
jgi:hypothetical protein